MLNDRCKWRKDSNFDYPHTVVLLSPKQFLELTPPLPYREEYLERASSELMKELTTGEMYRPWLKVDPTGKVLEHEGRTRAVAAARLGCELPVELYFFDKESYEYLEPPERLPSLKPQEWDERMKKEVEVKKVRIDGVEVSVLCPKKSS